MYWFDMSEQLPHELYLHIGSNINDRAAYLINARKAIQAQIGPILRASSIFETAAWGITNQPDFLNQALYLRTYLSPQDCLAATQRIETQLGRKRQINWGPRTIDIDLLFYDDLVLETDALQLPHPWLHQRQFVLAPLAEIAPDLLHPTLHKSIQELKATCRDEADVWVWQA